VSASYDANLSVIENRAVPTAWLSAGPGTSYRPPARSVAVLRPRPALIASRMSGPSDISEAPLLETQKLALAAPTP